MMLQMPLGLTLRDDATFESFYTNENNKQIVVALKNMLNLNKDNIIFIHGEKGSGKSHLLQALCSDAYNLGKSAIYFSLADLNSQPSMLQDLDNLDLICIDDVDNIAGNNDWETSLFHLFNRVHAKSGKLLFAAQNSPLHLKLQLKDLKSRLSWGLAMHLTSLSDEEKMQALKIRAQYRGINLDDGVTKFLLRHYARSTTELFAALEKLDVASLEQKRKLTVPFVKNVLEFQY